MGAEAAIPPRSNRRGKRGCDRALYRERNRIERMFARPRQFRGIATRCAKLAVSFMGFLHLAAILLWLK
jgi:putative transposase